MRNVHSESFIELEENCLENIDYFNTHKTVIKLQYVVTLLNLQDNIRKTQILITKIDSFCNEYDFDEHTKGNGYRSFIDLYESALRHSLKILKSVSKKRGNWFFRKQFFLKEIEISSKIFFYIHQVCENLLTIRENSDDGFLYANAASHENYIANVIKDMESSYFYGTALGFQYCPSIKKCLKTLVFAMTTFSEGFYNSGNAIMITIRVILKAIQYAFNLELCGQRMAQITRHSSVQFYKSFVNVIEGYVFKYVPALVGAKIEVNELFSISHEPIKLFSENKNAFIDVVMPSDFEGVKVHLLSAKRRSGMVGEKSSIYKRISNKPSKHLLIHSQGSGWTMQSSKTHELYLREWAVKLDVPIITIYYSLAPESPFPQALNEIFFVYCWALKNCGLLGSTGENIVMAGDSSGANLNIACVLKCIELGIRKPRGIFNAYPPLLMNLKSTPSGFLCLFDAIVPYYILMRCYIAYMVKKATYDDKEIKDSSSTVPHSPDDEFINVDYAPKNPFLVPYWASDEMLKQLPATTIISTNFDTCLDDCIMFSKKLRNLGVQTELTIFEGLFHGFLNVSTESKEAHEATTICMHKVARLLGMNLKK